VVRGLLTGGTGARGCGVLAWRPYLAPLLLTGVAAESCYPAREVASHLHVAGMAPDAKKTRWSHDGRRLTRLRPTRLRRRKIDDIPLARASCRIRSTQFAF
jgi:hypothetical protein